MSPLLLCKHKLCAADILRNFNPAIKGFSVGRGDENSAGAKMNVAVAGAIAQFVLH